MCARACVRGYVCIQLHFLSLLLCRSMLLLSIFFTMKVLAGITICIFVASAVATADNYVSRPLC